MAEDSDRRMGTGLRPEPIRFRRFRRDRIPVVRDHEGDLGLGSSLPRSRFDGGTYAPSVRTGRWQRAGDQQCAHFHAL